MSRLKLCKIIERKKQRPSKECKLVQCSQIKCCAFRLLLFGFKFIYTFFVTGDLASFPSKHGSHIVDIKDPAVKKQKRKVTPDSKIFKQLSAGV